MKITKNKLRRIINEELKKILEGEVIPFQPRFGGRDDGASDETYEDEGDDDPLKKFKDDIFNGLKSNIKDDKKMKGIRANLDKIFSGDNLEAAQEKHDKIFIKAIGLGPSNGKPLERVLKVINDLADPKKADEEKEDYLKTEQNK